MHASQHDMCVRKFRIQLQRFQDSVDHLGRTSLGGPLPTVVWRGRSTLLRFRHMPGRTWDLV
jgi:hypothetical protein